MRSRTAARWRLPSSTTVRNERICSSMPKTGADRATLQCLLGTTRPEAGALLWVDYTTEKYIMTTAFAATDKDFERMMQMLTGFFVTQIAGAVATYSIADHLAKRPATAEQIAAIEGIDPAATFRLLCGLASFGLVSCDAGLTFGWIRL